MIAESHIESGSLTLHVLLIQAIERAPHALAGLVGIEFIEYEVGGTLVEEVITVKLLTLLLRFRTV